MMARGGAWQRRPASGAGGGREDSKRNKVVGAWRQGIGGRPSPGTRRGVEGREGTQGSLGGRSRSWMGAGGLGPGGGKRHGAQPEGGRG